MFLPRSASYPPNKKRPEPKGSGRTNCPWYHLDSCRNTRSWALARPSPVTEGPTVAAYSSFSPMLRDDFSGRFTGASTNRALSQLSLTGYCFPSSQFPISCFSIVYPFSIVKFIISFGFFGNLWGENFFKSFLVIWGLHSEPLFLDKKLGANGFLWGVSVKWVGLKIAFSNGGSSS